MFGRAAIRLGIGPHSSCVKFSFFSTKSSERLVSNMSEMTYVCVEWVAKP